MPTTCGFPNCKFRSRYRGQEDNRHFYRIPKRPSQLRQRWLNAIGRTEETVVSQLRICSAHFVDGEKREGDIPVPDPLLDPPVFMSLPPKELRGGNCSERIQRLAAKRSKLLHHRLPPTAHRKRHSIRINRQFGIHEHRKNFGQSSLEMEPRGVESIFQKAALQQQQDFADSTANFPVSSSCSPRVPFFLAEGLPGQLVGGPLQPPHLRPFLNLFGMSKPSMTNSSGQRPLVALLDGRDCSIEMPLLKDVATVAFCDAQSTTEIHEKVLNEAVAALLYHSINLSKEDLMKFKALKVVVRIGSGVHNVDLVAATELGIAICNTPAECVEETADSTLSLILNMYRKTFWIAKAVQSGRQANNVEQLRELVAGCTRIRGSTLGLIGLGRVGTAVAMRAKAFGFKVIFYDPHLPNGIDRALGIERCETLGDVLSRSDCISLHCPLLRDTRYMFNQESMQKMKFGAFLINTSAAELIMNSALLSALKTGQVRAAALDIYEKECVDDISSEIFAQMPNVICTPHCAWFSDESSKELRVSAAKEIRRALEKRIPQDLVNCMNKEGLLSAARNRADSKTAGHQAVKHMNGVQQQQPKPNYPQPLHLNTTAAPPPSIALSASDPFASFAAAGIPTDALTAFGSSTENHINPLSYQNFLMSLNPMLLNNNLLHQQQQQMHPSSMAAAIATSNSNTPSIYDFGQQVHSNLLQSNMHASRKDISKARQIKKEEHMGSRSPTTSPMPKRSNQSASGNFPSNGDQKESDSHLILSQQKDASGNGSPKASGNEDVEQQMSGETSFSEANAPGSPKQQANTVADEEGGSLQIEEGHEEIKA